MGSTVSLDTILNSTLYIYISAPFLRNTHRGQPGARKRRWRHRVHRGVLDHGCRLRKRGKKIMPSSNGITRAVALGTGSASARPRAVTKNARRRSIWCSQRGLGVCLRRAAREQMCPHFCPHFSSRYVSTTADRKRRLSLFFLFFSLFALLPHNHMGKIPPPYYFFPSLPQPSATASG